MNGIRYTLAGFALKFGKDERSEYSVIVKYIPSYTQWKKTGM
jgi:hypothetical protein